MKKTSQLPRKCGFNHAPKPDGDRRRCAVHRWRNVAGKLPKNDTQLHERVEVAYWAALDEATSPADGEARLRRLVTDLERSYPSAAACLAEDLPALCVHLEYPLRLRKRLRSTNLLERSLEEVKRRTKVIGRFPGETSCLSLCWAVLDLFIACARGLALTALEHRLHRALRARRSGFDYKSTSLQPARLGQTGVVNVDGRQPTSTDRARLRQLDRCLNVLEEARELGEGVVSPALAARVRPLVPGVDSGMPIGRALDRVFHAQDDCHRPSGPAERSRVTEPLGPAGARALTDRIKTATGRSSLLLVEAQERRAWLALGYRSWERYVRTELGLSRTRSYELLDHGRLIRAIESATGVRGAVDVPPYTARRLKPYIGELIASLERRAAGRPAEEIPSIVRDAVRERVTRANPPPRDLRAPGLDPDVFWTVVGYLSAMPPAAEAAPQLTGEPDDCARLERSVAWLADLAARLRTAEFGAVSRER